LLGRTEDDSILAVPLRRRKGKGAKGKFSGLEKKEKGRRDLGNYH